MRYRKLVAALALFGAASSCTGAGGRGQECTPHTWQGMCVLQNLQTVRITEAFPRSLVTLEAIYMPQPNASNPRYAPLPIKNTIRAFADDEVALRAHLKKYSPVRCEVVGPTDETCGPAHATVDVPPFIPPTQKPQVNEPHGCALLDAQEQSAGVSKPMAPEALKKLGLPDRVLFDAGSAVVGSDAAAQIQQAAHALAAHPEVECVAVVGHVTHGESIGLADDRAHAVKQALLAAGVDAARLRTFGAGVAMYGEGAEPLPPDPQQRNVQFKVLGYKKSAAP